MFGRYEMIDRIGLGGMAEVWLARVGGVGGFSKTVVIKKILPSFAQNKTFIDMLLAEARLCAVLQHANIVQVYENGEIDGIFYIAMEYVAGFDLFKVLSRATQTQQRIPPEICLYIAAEAAKGLHYAHNARDHYGSPLHIIHRDVSPSNLILSQSGEVKIMDFGVARATPPGGQRENATRSGVLKGKLGYMSPEQVTGRQFDHRSDIFSLGIILYESLTLKRLFLAKTDLETLVNIRDARLEHKFKKHSYIDEDFRNVLRKALAREPADRYPTALAMHDDIQQVLFDRRQHVSGSAMARFLTDLFDPAKGQSVAPDAAQVAARVHERPPARQQSDQVAGVRAPPAPMAQTRPAMPSPTAMLRGDGAGPAPAASPAQTAASPNHTSASTSLSFSPEEGRKLRERIAQTPAQVATPSMAAVPARSTAATADPAAVQAPTATTGRQVAVPVVPAPPAHEGQDAAVEADDLGAALADGARILAARGPRPDSIRIVEPPPKRPKELRITLIEPRAGSGDAGAGPAPGQQDKPAEDEEAPAIVTAPAAVAAPKPAPARLGFPLVAGASSAKIAAQQPAATVAAPGRVTGRPTPQNFLESDELGYDSGAHAPQTDPEPEPMRAADNPAIRHSAILAEAEGASRHDLSELIVADDDAADLGLAVVVPPHASVPEPTPAGAVSTAALGVAAARPASPIHFTDVDAAEAIAPRSRSSQKIPATVGESSRSPFEVREPTLLPLQLDEPSRPPFDADGMRAPFDPQAARTTGEVPLTGRSRPSARQATVREADHGAIAESSQAALETPHNSDLADGRVLTDRGTQPAFDGRPEPRSYSIAGSARGLERAAFRVRLSDGTELDPMSAHNLEQLIRAGRVSLDDFVAVGEGPFQPMRSVTQLTAMVTALMEQRKPPTLSGPLSQWVFVRLVYKLAADRMTGSLELRRGDAVKSIYFRRGRTQYIASNQYQELLGPFMVANGYVTQVDVDMAIARSKQTGTRLGDLLISLNLIKPFQLYQVLERQMRAKFIDAFGWDAGTYAFYDGVEPPQEIVPLDVDPISVLAEGVRERVPLAVLEPMFADKLDRRLHRVKNPLINLASLKLQARESKAVTMLHAAETPRQAYDECFANRQQRLALLHVLFLMLQTELITFDADRA